MLQTCFTVYFARLGLAYLMVWKAAGDASNPWNAIGLTVKFAKRSDSPRPKNFGASTHPIIQTYMAPSMAPSIQLVDTMESDMLAQVDRFEVQLEPRSLDRRPFHWPERP